MTSSRVLFAGRATLDLIYALDEFPAQDTKVFARNLHAAPGGPATNAAITHALLGGKAVLMSALGAGRWAAAVRAELERLEIKLVDLAAGTTYEFPLTTALVNEVGATRTIVNPPQSLVLLEEVAGWDASFGEMPRLVLTDGFHLRETLPLLKACREAGARLCFDGGSWKPGTDQLARLLSVSICSERFEVPGRPADSDAVIQWFQKMGVAHIAITRGAKPILGCDAGRRFEIEIARIEAAHTLGAGDVLHGAFCYEFERTGEFEPSLRQAAKIATASCRGEGIRGWMEYLKS